MADDLVKRMRIWLEGVHRLRCRLHARSMTEFFVPGSMVPELLRCSDETLEEAIVQVRTCADRIEQLEAALQKIAAIEDEHINAPKTAAEANLWAILAKCVDLADAALSGEKKSD